METLRSPRSTEPMKVRCNSQRSASWACVSPRAVQDVVQAVDLAGQALALRPTIRIQRRHRTDLPRLCSVLAGLPQQRFYASLHDGDERKLVAEVEALAQRADRRFFHWEIEFPEVFFGFADAGERQIRHKDRLQEGSAGFDCVVGNPPYDVLAEKELETDLNDLLGFLNNASVFQAARGGKQNLYKLFVCRGAYLLHRGGRLGHIVPMPLLGDEQAAGVRRMLLTDTCLAAVEAFPLKDDPRNRVFEDAKPSAGARWIGRRPRRASTSSASRWAGRCTSS
ncbi:MAG: Eco57I restriction-modification methylase domain-containing protein [Opitutales bacterium]